MMNTVTHAMIDGSTLTLTGDVDLGAHATTLGMVRVPHLGRSQGFQIQSRGFSYRLENTPPPMPAGAEIGSLREFSLKGGVLRIVDVAVPQPLGPPRQVTFAGWEGAVSCIWTSRVRSSASEMIAIFDTADFAEREDGAFFRSPIDSSLKDPTCIKEIPGLAVLSILPLTRKAKRRLPRRRGAAARHGELFRLRDSSPVLLLVTESAVATIDPLERDAPAEERMLETAYELAVRWRHDSR